MYPQLEVALSAAKRIQNFDCWVFRDELTPPHEPLPNGQVVELLDQNGSFLAYAFYSSHSHIACRVVSTKRDEPIDRALLARRIKTALAQRESIIGTNAKRLIFSEADRLPGLIVDQYDDYLVLQVRAAGMEALKPTVVELLKKLVHPKGILERSDKEFREEDELPPITQVLTGTVPERIMIAEDDLQFWVDPYKGQKTGFYLDQRETRRAVRELIKPKERVADVCAYTGAFGIVAASQGAQVVCVEQQEACLSLARDNARQNKVEHLVTFVEGNAFYWLEAKAATSRSQAATAAPCGTGSQCTWRTA
jgi:23S rRNA (cytosine1962-C5)-methyltransferase